MAKVKQMQEEAVPETQEKGRRTVIAMFRGDVMNESVRIKMDAMSILTRFLAKVRPDAEVMEDQNSIVVVVDGPDGDVGWLDEHVIRFTSLVGSGYRTGDLERKAEEMYDRFENEKDADPSMVGAGFLIAYLNRYYLIQKLASVYRREC